MTLTDMGLTEFMRFTEKRATNEALYSVNKRHDFTGIHDINGKFPYDDIFRKNHARLYFGTSWIHVVYFCYYRHFGGYDLYIIAIISPWSRSEQRRPGGP